METGIIFNIQHYCIHDGPGIRTNVFLKGCPLRCRWCANPESNLVMPQLMFSANKCTACGRCIAVCPSDAITFAMNGVRTDRRVCDGCGTCVQVCPNAAREITGRKATAEEVMREIEMDRLFYDSSGGGVTLTGGEVFAQPEFAAAVLGKCREAGIHTAVETCGYADWDAVEKVMRQTDLVLYDIKHMDSGRHREGTGAGNERILANLIRISDEMKIPVIVRAPVIPGYNDQSSNFRALGEFVSGQVRTCHEIDLLPYHTLGKGKREQLEEGGEEIGVNVPSGEEMETHREILREYGLTVC